MPRLGVAAAHRIGGVTAQHAGVISRLRDCVIHAAADGIDHREIDARERRGRAGDGGDVNGQFGGGAFLDQFRDHLDAHRAARACGRGVRPRQSDGRLSLLDDWSAGSRARVVERVRCARGIAKDEPPESILAVRTVEEVARRSKGDDPAARRIEAHLKAGAPKRDCSLLRRERGGRDRRGGGQRRQYPQFRSVHLWYLSQVPKVERAPRTPVLQCPISISPRHS
jgi:hypothetical protein